MKRKSIPVLAAILLLLNFVTYSQNNAKMKSKKAELCYEIESKLGEGAFYNAKNNFDSNVIISQHVKLVQEIFPE